MEPLLPKSRAPTSEIFASQPTIQVEIESEEEEAQPVAELQDPRIGVMTVVWSPAAVRAAPGPYVPPPAQSRTIAWPDDATSTPKAQAIHVEVAVLMKDYRPRLYAKIETELHVNVRLAAGDTLAPGWTDSLRAYFQYTVRRVAPFRELHLALLSNCGGCLSIAGNQRAQQARPCWRLTPEVMYMYRALRWGYI